MFQTYVSPLLIIIISFNISAANDEIRSRCSNSFRSYAHCIEKRETYEWCTAQGCNICRDNSCHLTCKGFSCGKCPTGSCCDGKNCNACYNNKCCATSACNFGLTVCRQACSSNSSCLDSCIQQCYNSTHDIFVIPSQKLVAGGNREVLVYINGTSFKAHVSSGHIDAKNRTAVVVVNGKKHNATILSLFPFTNICEDGSCNRTLCTNSSSNETSNYEPGNCNQKLTLNNNTIVQSFNNTVVGRFNVTTIINITNVINNTNKIDNPVSANNTNFNNVTLAPLRIGETQNVIHHIHDQHNHLPQGCCHILHPPHCYNTHNYPYYHCFRRSHQECSNICTSRFIHITTNSTLKLHQHQCHYIRSYPYVYCGQYSLHNCESCYVCNGQYNPNFCFHESGCSNACKQSLSPPTVPEFHRKPQSYRIVHPGTPEHHRLMELLRQNHTLQPRIGVAYQHG